MEISSGVGPGEGGTVSKRMGSSAACQVPASEEMARSGKTPKYRYLHVGFWAAILALARIPAGQVNS